MQDVLYMPARYESFPLLHIEQICNHMTSSASELDIKIIDMITYGEYDTPVMNDNT